VCAPFIVFGHSHAPERVSLAGGATYFNTGTWASDDASHAFTHLMVVGDEDGAPKAELRQWRDGTSAPFKRG
jgi:predicted phosphodiesterase